MRLTAKDVVADGVKSHEADIRPCASCKGVSFHVPQEVMVLSASGARKMRLWTCEQHPLPDTITDNPDNQD
jgi:hypothetical protein